MSENRSMKVLDLFSGILLGASHLAWNVREWKRRPSARLIHFAGRCLKNTGLLCRFIKTSGH